jgi:two-component sensor histidine kinase
MKPLQRSPSSITEIPDSDTLIRELNHRVKNNFQIIVSLLNLRKRMMPPERREDIRFIEEHVQSMSVAYRLVYATGSMIDVSLSELIGEVLSGLRLISGLADDQLRIEMKTNDASIGLDHAIALALYLSVLLPPYLDAAIARAGEVTVTATLTGDLFSLSVGCDGAAPADVDFLRARLMKAYAGQLNAEMRSAGEGTPEVLRFVIAQPA